MKFLSLLYIAIIAVILMSTTIGTASAQGGLVIGSSQDNSPGNQVMLKTYLFVIQVLFYTLKIAKYESEIIF